MSQRGALVAFILAGLTVAAGPSRAAVEGCAFDWPLTAEIGWFQAAKVEDVPSGTELPEVTDEALALGLVAYPDAKLPITPSRTRDGDGPNAGFVSFATVPAGTYQVTIASDGWIDLVQDGASLKALEHTGSKSCADARKSVRYAVSAGKLVVQVTGASGPSIKIAIKRLN